MPQVKASEITVHKVDSDRIYVLSDMLAYHKEWPETFDHAGQTFYFNGREVMPKAALGNYSSCAIYLKH